MTERQALSHFLGGLKLELQAPVRMVQPQTVYDAFSLAKLHESMLGATEKPTSNRTRFSPVQEPLKASNTTTPTAPSWRTTNPRSSKILTSKEIEEKRSKGLCFGCEEKYTPGHKCKHHQLFLMEIEEDEAPLEDEQTQEVTVEEQPLISLHAMTGSFGGSTIRVEGQAGNRRLHILIDSGSTHNFLDTDTARKLGCH